MKKILLILGMLMLSFSANATSFAPCDSDVLVFYALAGNKELADLVLNIANANPPPAVSGIHKTQELVYLNGGKDIRVVFDMYFMTFASSEAADKTWLNTYALNMNRNPAIMVECLRKK